MILLTGYSGFIGSNFEGRCDFQPINLRNLGNPLEGFENQNATLIHLASPLPGGENTEKEMVELMDRIVNSMKMYPKINLILASSIRVYSSGGPFNPETIPSPFDQYGFGKLRCEEMVKELDDGRRIDIVRIASVQGKSKNQYRGVSGIFGKQAKEGVIRIQGDGNSIKDLIHVDEVVDALVGLSKMKDGGIFLHALGRHQISVLDLAKKIASINGAKIVHGEEDPHDLSGYFDIEWSSKLPRENVLLSKIIEDVVLQ